MTCLYCEKMAKGYGLYDKHYQRWRRRTPMEGPDYKTSNCKDCGRPMRCATRCARCWSRARTQRWMTNDPEGCRAYYRAKAKRPKARQAQTRWAREILKGVMMGVRKNWAQDYGVIPPPEMVERLAKARIIRRRIRKAQAA